METIINVYQAYHWLIAFHLLMLVVLIYAAVQIGKHPGPSVCVITAVILDFGNFLFGLFVHYDNDPYQILEHVRNSVSLISSILLFIAIFGWRSSNQISYKENLNASLGDFDINNLSAKINPVNIPVGWTITVTVLNILAYPLWFSVGAMAVTVSENDSLTGWLVVTALVALVTSIIGVVFTLKILYRGWLAIQDEHARTTPEKAIGFLFIPVYNLYWIFVAWAGLAKNFNSFISRYNIPARRLSEGLFTTQCVLLIAGIILNRIPVIDIIYVIVISIIILVILWNITRAVNDVYACMTRSQTEPLSINLANETPITEEKTDNKYAPPGYFD